jgi:hypothetical protein
VVDLPLQVQTLRQRLADSRVRQPLVLHRRAVLRLLRLLLERKPRHPLQRVQQST